ncbi:uracil-DNA glycosylase [Mycobacterium sp. CVI_P3]|uniref:Uracil-DNA glycosylase n=1 Tax=Mycobacterium pinniadriaticum TaxID=2994102 RepID=A0ABT3SBM0_9MYCO|nr:uracil-DNA glycosylase [Mycobacterium pinniadriaticum]MCX2930451.1 uracil-DNA glycosylase [Mycobacterium pinniadriaticum]MCX2936875.1 uracil-DNA glycosylase [Mycobacterium pinniadriaticum]
MTTTARPLSELVDDGWAQALSPVGEQVAQMGQFLRAEIAAGRRYLPAGPNVLRAFTFPFSEVRVLIVGQDPYPTPGHAVGLSFSVAPDVRPLPRSLANIFTEYSADLGYPQPSNGDLTPWSQRGVMLLNRVLTVRPGNPASHRGKGWEAVTECAIRALVARDQPMVAILWGRDASTLKPMLDGSGGQERSDPGGGSRCVAIESPHPSPLSASRGFFGSRPFSRANELLTGMGAEPIDWRLP